MDGMPEPKGALILDDRGIVVVGGDDRVAFLQGLVSNDVASAGTRAVHAALLTPQGKYLHDLFIVPADGVHLLDCEAARAEDLARRLKPYRLRAKVTIDVAPQTYRVAALLGPLALQRAGLDPASGGAPPGTTVAFGGGWAFIDPRLPALGGRAVLPAETAATTLSALGVPLLPAADYDGWRLALGVPDGSRDLVPEKSILLESGFDELNGIAWDKGCWMGQELTARTKYRGLVKKRLLPVDVDGPLPPPGTVVMLDDREAGEIRSGRGTRALALLRLEHLAAVRETGQPLRAGDATLTPRIPAWARL